MSRVRAARARARARVRVRVGVRFTAQPLQLLDVPAVLPDEAGGEVTELGPVLDLEDRAVLSQARGHRPLAREGLGVPGW
eukprot:scaffold59923_cov33-Phaeocystis_antarctica.AAC.1